MSLPEFLKTIAGIAQLEDSGITALYQTLEVQTRLSLANVKLYVSELRGIEYLMDHVAQNPNVEIRVINTTADEFVNWLQQDTPIAGQRKKKSMKGA
jgi:hypothetical protein